MRCDIGEEKRDFNRGKLRTHEIAGAAGFDYLGALLPRPSESMIGDARMTLGLESNVKDEPRLWPARRVPNYYLGSGLSW